MRGALDALRRAGVDLVDLDIPQLADSGGLMIFGPGGGDWKILAIAERFEALVGCLTTETQGHRVFFV